MTLDLPALCATAKLAGLPYTSSCGPEIHRSQQQNPYSPDTRPTSMKSPELKRRATSSAKPAKSAKSAVKPAAQSAIQDRKSEITNQKSEIVLLAVTGMSPAVLTETVWALAREKPATIPDHVIVLTTLAGSHAIEQELLTPPSPKSDSVWQTLRRAILGPAADADRRLIVDPPRVILAADPRTGISRPLEDIRTPRDNEAVAEYILEEVRRVAENPDVRLVASLAGGRKTMGALLYAALTLLGRETDRLTHVLVNEPFEDPRLQPRFYFPAPNPVLHRAPSTANRASGEHSSADARIELADVPFVPLRNRFADLAEVPGGFHTLIRRYSRQLRIDASRRFRIEIRHADKRLVIDHSALPIRPKALAILHALLELQSDAAVRRGQLEAQDAVSSWLSRHPTGWSGQVSSDDLKHELSYLRTELRKHRLGWEPPLRSLRFPPFYLVHPR